MKKHFDGVVTLGNTPGSSSLCKYFSSLMGNKLFNVLYCLPYVCL